jgi:hypothetical protein
MYECRHFGGDVVGNRVHPTGGVEVKVFGQTTPEPRRLGGRKPSVAIHRTPVATTSHLVRAAAADPASQLGFDDDTGSHLKWKASV